MSSTRPSTADELLDGRWRLGALLGSGAAADVHAATDEQTGRPVAVKVLRVGGDPEARRFEREVEALESLSHPNVVEVIAHGDCGDGRRYLVTERVEGGTLAARLRSGPLDEADAAAIGRDLASALDHVHAAGVVHRDVKPANVLLDEDGRAKLADFGIVRLDGADTLTTGGWALGTPAYLSPEQVRGEPIGPPSDVYSLGLVVLEAVTGQRTFEGQGIPAALARLEERAEVPASVSPRLRAALVAMTEPDPERRPSAGTCALLLGEALEGATEAIPIAATATTAIPTAPEGARPAAVVPASAAATAAVAGAAAAGAPVPPPVRSGPRPWEAWVAALRRNPRRAMTAAAVVLGVLLLALAVANEGHGLSVPETTVPSTTTTTTTTVPPTTAPPPPVVEGDGEERDDDEGGGNGNGRGNGRDRDD